MTKTGLQRLLAKVEKYRGRNLAIIANHTSITADFQYCWDVLYKNGITIKKIFSPEHGLFGAEQDQIPVSARLNLPFEVVSLYGRGFESLSPLDEHLSGIDCVLFDIQGIGVRYYTYVNTMVLFLKKIGSRDIEFIVLDRPNPLGGAIVEGPVLKKGYESFVGVLPVPVRHGLTPGEMARLAIDYFGLHVNCSIIEMTGWKRRMSFRETMLPWVPPSPNMPTLNTVLVYPGTCLFEGTNVSEGRGTTTPFELVGAPGVEPYALVEELKRLDLPGVIFRPSYFRPTFNKHRDVLCGGVFIHVTDHEAFKPFLTGIAMVRAFRSLMADFQFTTGAYEFNEVHPAFDLLTGSSAEREMIIAGKTIDLIASLWEKEEKVFSGISAEYHLY